MWADGYLFSITIFAPPPAKELPGNYVQFLMYTK